MTQPEPLQPICTYGYTPVWSLSTLITLRQQGYRVKVNPDGVQVNDQTVDICTFSGLVVASGGNAHQFLAKLKSVSSS